MSMLKERLQVMIDSEQRARLERHARDRGTSVATLVREAIDAAFPADTSRQAAADVVLTADPMPVGDVADLLTELDELRAGRA